jgi:UDP-GlcNAc:undecaprenyl-phosphate/decaprenyl-phosphate GlcNAc-1-phosphate transferase
MNLPDVILVTAVFAASCMAFSWLPVRLKTLGTGAKNADAFNRWNASRKPAVGGIGFMLFFPAGMLTAMFVQDHSGPTGWLVLGGAGVAFVTGMTDDMYRLKPAAKLTGQMLAATILCLAGAGDLAASEPANFLLQMLLAVGMMNSINMFDNMDGSAAIAALPVMIWFTGGPFAHAAVCMTGVLLGFLIYNRYPSRIYMGDSGSMLLGYIMAFFFIQSGIPGERPVAGVYLTPLLLVFSLFALPLADSLVVVINRIRHGISPTTGGRDHSTHHLVYAGLSEGGVTRLLIFLTGTELLMAWLFRSPSSPVAGSVAPVLLFFLALFAAAFQLSRRNLQRGKFSYSR